LAYVASTVYKRTYVFGALSYDDESCAKGEGSSMEASFRDSEGRCLNTTPMTHGSFWNGLFDTFPLEAERPAVDVYRNKICQWLKNHH
jgi:hypothetical protein